LLVPNVVTVPGTTLERASEDRREFVEARE
jgi:hypothetical protein